MIYFITIFSIFGTCCNAEVRLQYEKGSFQYLNSIGEGNLTYPHSYQPGPCQTMKNLFVKITFPEKVFIDKIEVFTKERFMDTKLNVIVSGESLAADPLEDANCNCGFFLTEFKMVAATTTNEFALEIGDEIVDNLCIARAFGSVLQKIVSRHYTESSFTLSAASFSNSISFEVINNLLIYFQIHNQQITSVNAENVETFSSESPIAWFSFKLKYLCLVEKIIVYSYTGSHEHVLIKELWITFRMKNDRKFVSYEEFDDEDRLTTKKFYAKIHKIKFAYTLQRPFIANEIRIYVGQGEVNMNFKWDLFTQEAFDVFQEKPFVTSAQMLRAENATTFVVDLQNVYLVSSLVFNDLSFLESFCIYYQSDSEIHAYKDDPNFDEPTIFATTENTVYLREIRARKIYLKCLDLYAVPQDDLTVHVAGDYFFTPEYQWTKYNYSILKDSNLYMYNNTRGKEPLYGNSAGFLKSSVNQKLMSNNFGSDCFTRPHLCDEGLSVQLLLEGKPELNAETIKLRPEHFWTINSEDNVLNGDLFNGKDTIKYFTVISYRIFLEGVIDIEKCYLKFGETVGSFNADLYVIASQDPDLEKTITEYLQFQNNYGFKHNPARKVQVEFNSEIDLSEIMRKVWMAHDGIINSIIFIFAPADMQPLVEVKLPKGVIPELHLQYHIPELFVGNIHPVNSEVDFSGKKVTLFLGKRYLLFGLWLKTKLGPASITFGINVYEVFQRKDQEIFQFTIPETDNSYHKFRFQVRAQNIYVIRQHHNFVATDELVVFGYAISGNYTPEFQDDACFVDESILTKEECYKRADDFKLHLGVINSVTANYPNNIHGCSSFGNKLYWNLDGSPKSAHTDGTFLCYKQKDTEQILERSSPILSIGLSGSTNSLNGTGVKVYYNDQNLVAVVKTNVKIHKVSVEMSELPSKNHTITLSWNKKKLELFIDKTPVGVEVVTGVNTTNLFLMIPSDYDFVNVFGDYHHVLTNSRVSLQNIKLWRAPLSIEEITMHSESKQKDIFSYPYIGIASCFHYGSNCNCEEVECPCEVQDTSLNATLQSKTATVVELSEDWTFIEKIMKIQLKESYHSAVVTFTIKWDFKNIQIKSLVLEATLNKDKKDACSNINVYVGGKSSNVPWCGGYNVGDLVQSPDLSATFKDLFKRQKIFSTVEVSLSITQLYLEANSLLKIEYYPPKPEKIPLKTEIVTYYRRQISNIWTDIQVPTYNDTNHMYNQIEIVAFTNGLNDGYLMFRDIYTTNDLECSVQPVGSQSLYTMEEISKTFQANMLPVPTAILTNMGSLLTNEMISTEELNLTTVYGTFLSGSQYQIKASTLVFDYPLFNDDWTITFWYDGSVGNTDVLSININDGVIVHFSFGGDFRIYLNGKDLGYVNEKCWNFITLSYSKMFSKLYAQVGSRLTTTMAISEIPINSTGVVIKIEEHTANFQLFYGILSRSQLFAMQVPATQHSTLACNNTDPTCFFCNVAKGEIELKQFYDESLVNKTMCTHEPDMMSNYSIYYPMDVPVDSFYHSLINGNKFEHTFTPVPGVTTNALCLTDSNSVKLSSSSLTSCDTNCHLSVWIKLQCVETKAPFMILDEFIFSQNYPSSPCSSSLDTLILEDRHCLYCLKINVGLWVHIGMTFHVDQTFEFYQNLELHNLTCVRKSFETQRVNKGTVISSTGTKIFFDEFSVGNYPLYGTHLNNILGGSGVEKIMRRLVPIRGKFCSYESYQILPAWTYEVQKKREEVEENIMNDMVIITEVQHVALYNLYTPEAGSMFCGNINFYLLPATTDITEKLENLNARVGYNYEITTDSLAEYPDILAAEIIYNVSSVIGTSVTLKVVVPEPVANIVVEVIAQVWITEEPMNVVNFTVKNMNCFVVEPLEKFRNYSLCFKVNLIDNYFGNCIAQNESFYSAEGVPFEKTFIKPVIDIEKSLVNVSISLINDTGWKGFPFSYQVSHWYQYHDDNCTSLNSTHPGFDISHATNFTIAYKDVNAQLQDGKIVFSINSTCCVFERICLVAFATTQNGTGIGVLTTKLIRTQVGAPEVGVSNITATFNNSSVEWCFKPLPSTREIWNFPRDNGSYIIHGGSIYNGSYLLTNMTQYETNFSCHSFPDAMCSLQSIIVMPKSVKTGPVSDDYCALSKLDRPHCMTAIIKNHTILGSREVGFDMERFFPTYWRGGEPHYSFSITKLDENGTELSVHIQNRTADLSHSIEEYAEKAKACNRSVINEYLNQSTEFVNLTLNKLEPYTCYKVFVRPCNEYGCGNASVNVTVCTYTDIPTCAPAVVSLQNTSFSSILATWEALPKNCSHGEILGYNITCNRSQADEQIKLFVKENTTFEFQDLECYELLSCIVAGTTINGTGPYSSPRLCLSEECEPNARPTHQNLTRTTNSVRIQLVKPDRRMNGVVRKVMYCVRNVSTNIWEVNCTGVTCEEVHIPDRQVFMSGEFEVNFENLAPACMYNITMTFKNTVTFGRSKSFLVTTNNEIPEAPVSMSNSSDNVRSIRVEYGEIPPIGRRGNITGYKVCRQHVLEDETLKEKVCFNTTKQEYNFTGLERGSTHLVSISGCNKAGCGKELQDMFQAMQFVDGIWTEWGNWGECSVTCNYGIELRYRTCIPPTPGGYQCNGSDVDSQRCDRDLCSGFVEGKDGENDCNVICRRVDLYCSEIYLKFYNDTSVLTESSARVNCSLNTNYSLYNKDYQPAFHSESKDCHGYMNIEEDFICDAKDRMLFGKLRRVCNCVAKSDLGFKGWAPWSACSSTCGPSRRIRKRICKTSCTGPYNQKKVCKTPECPIDGEWGNWTSIDKVCNDSCGVGYKRRIRLCENPETAHGGTYCVGVNEDNSYCNLMPCPVHGNVSEWSKWTECNEPCGPANATRHRLCNNPSPDYKGNDCEQPLSEIRACNLSNCVTVRVNVTIQFTNMTWKWQMYNINAPEAHNVAKVAKKLMKDKYGDAIQDVIIHKLHSGSIFVDYTLSFPYLYDQIVTLQDDLLTNGRLINEPVGNIAYDSIDVNCPPPKNISVTPHDRYTVNLTWSMVVCNRATWIFVYYMDMDEPDAVWEKVGVSKENNWALVANLVTSHRYKAYMLVALSYGNGLPSSIFFMMTAGSPPSKPPPTATSNSPASTKIYVEWTDIPWQYRNGPLSGYRIKYKKYMEIEEYTVLDVQFGFNAFTIKGLVPFTLYLLEVYGFNTVGNGPIQYTMCKTIEDVPSIPVPDFRVFDMQEIDWWAIFWGEIPERFTNGILLGYRLVYYVSYRSDIEISGEKELVTIDFDLFTRYYKARGLLNYAVYNVSVAGFTAAGSGPAPEYQARTCKCRPNLYMNWYGKEPFVSVRDGLYPYGYLMDSIKRMIVQSCDACKNWTFQIHDQYSYTGENPQKETEFELKNSIGEYVDVSFPIYGQQSREMVANSSFNLLVRSPGIYMVMRDESKMDDFVYKMIVGVFNVWPILLISYMIATIFGICIWFTDQFQNPEEFVIGSSFKGPLVGFWFAFITMTTVGYGDQSPRTISARVISMAWFLVGLVLNGMIIGFITTAVTSLGQVTEVTLYGTKTAAIKDSFEYRTAVMKNAIMEKDVEYTDVQSMLTSLVKTDVDVVYIDSFSLLGYQKTLEEKGLKIVSITNLETGYGYVLSGISQVLVPDMESLIGAASDEISLFTSDKINLVPEMKKEAAGEATADVFSHKSPAFAAALKWLAIAIATCTVMGLCFEVYRRNRTSRIYCETTFRERIDGLKDVVERFAEEFPNDIDQMSERHDKERIQLTDLKAAYQVKVERDGKVEADVMVSNRYFTSLSDIR